MRLTSWVENLKRHFGELISPANQHRRRPPKHLARAIDRLEDRTLLSAVSWDGEAGDFEWNNPLNWSGDNTTLPGVGDDVTIGNLGTATITVSGDAVDIRSLQT